MNKKQSILIISSLALLMPFSALAVPCPTTGVGALAPGPWLNCIVGNFRNLVLWPLFVGLVIIMFVWIAVLYLTAKGEPGKIETAKKASVWAIVGVAVAVTAFGSLATLRWLLGLP